MFSFCFIFRLRSLHIVTWRYLAYLIDFKSVLCSVYGNISCFCFSYSDNFAWFEFHGPQVYFPIILNFPDLFVVQHCDLNEYGKPFMYQRKRLGPKTDPWGTLGKTTKIITYSHTEIFSMFNWLQISVM